MSHGPRTPVPESPPSGPAATSEPVLPLDTLPLEPLLITPLLVEPLPLALLRMPLGLDPLLEPLVPELPLPAGLPLEPLPAFARGAGVPELHANAATVARASHP